MFICSLRRFRGHLLKKRSGVKPKKQPRKSIMECQFLSAFKIIDCSSLNLLDIDLKRSFDAEHIKNYSLNLNNNFLNCPNLTVFQQQKISLYNNPFLNCTCVKRLAYQELDPHCPEFPSPNIESTNLTVVIIVILLSLLCCLFLFISVYKLRHHLTTTFVNQARWWRKMGSKRGFPNPVYEEGI